MATLTTTSLANEYQKYFTKQLLQHAVQLTVMDQFALKQPLPAKKGAKTISFFRRSKSAVPSFFTASMNAVLDSMKCFVQVNGTEGEIHWKLARLTGYWVQVPADDDRVYAVHM